MVTRSNINYQQNNDMNLWKNGHLQNHWKILIILLDKGK